MPPPSALPRARQSRADSRLPQLLDAAAAQFAAKGYQAASIRDIVRSVGMLPGSLYCHFANKDELLAAVYAEGVRRISAAVGHALSRHTDPWDRLEAACAAHLEAACAAHLEALLDRSAYALVVTSVTPDSVPALAATLVSLRDGYEALFIDLIADLPLPARTARRTLRLLLLGALNGTPNWYRPGGRRTPRRLAREFVQLLKAPLYQPSAHASSSTPP